MEAIFDHEKLTVYQKTLAFIKWCTQNNIKLRESYNLHNQFEKAAYSILLNIAEGNGKFALKDKSRFFNIAIGSALECSACLDIFKELNKVSQDELVEKKTLLKEIVAMLIALIKSNSEREQRKNEK